MITGASGFVGRKLVRRLGERSPETRLIPVHGPSGAGGQVSLDLVDAEACLRLIREHRPTTIVHLAALSSVGATNNTPAEIWRSNLEGTRALALAALSIGADTRFIFASSGEVYGATFNNGPCDELSPLAPASPYARTKAACEYLLQDVSSSAFPVVVLRLFNHSGPGQDARFVIPAFAAQIAGVERLGCDGQIRVGNLTARRDFTDVDDIVEGYLRVILHEGSLPPFSVFNVGSGRTRSIQSILDTLTRLARVRIEAIPDPSRMRPSEIAVAEGVFKRFSETFDWVPERDFDGTIARILDDQRARLQGGGAC